MQFLMSLAAPQGLYICIHTCMQTNKQTNKTIHIHNLHFYDKNKTTNKDPNIIWLPFMCTWVILVLSEVTSLSGYITEHERCYYRKIFDI